MRSVGMFTSLVLLLAAAGWGCRSSDADSEAFANSMVALIRGMHQLVDVQQRLAYMIDLYRHETGGLPANAAELDAFIAARFQPAWLDENALEELIISVAPESRKSLQVFFSTMRNAQISRSAFPYPLQSPDYYVIVYNDIPMTNRAAATLLSHYTRRPVTPAILFDEYFIAEYEGAKDVLPPRLSLDGVRFVPIYPPPPEPASDQDDTAAAPGASEQQPQDQMSDGVGESASPQANPE